MADLIVDAGAINDAIEVAQVDLHEDYPDGFGIVFRLPRELIVFFLVVARHDEALAMELVQRMRRDAFGRSTVAFFPGVRIEPGIESGDEPTDLDSIEPDTFH